VSIAWIALWTIGALFALGVILTIALELVPKHVNWDCRNADAYVADHENWGGKYFREWRRVQLRFRWEPFCHWRSAPHDGSFIHVDAQGIRRTWKPQLTGAARPVRIFLFGGSTVWGAGVRDGGTLASALARNLARRGIEADVTNHGQLGYASTQEVIALLRRAQQRDLPDVVIFYDGYNDVLTAIQNQAAGLSFGEHNRRDEFNIFKTPWKMFWSTWRSLAIARYFRPRVREPAILTAERADSTAQEVADVLVTNYRVVRSLARELGFTAQFFWQPNIFGKLSVSAYEASQRQLIEFSRPVFRGVEERLARSNAIARGDDFVLLNDLFHESAHPYFIDWVHLSEAGNELVAARIANELCLKLPGARSPAQNGVGQRVGVAT